MAAEVAELLRQVQAADDEEDRRYGKDKRGDELPEELAFREGRLEKIREAMAALEAEAQAAAEQAETEGGKHPGVPDDKAQRNFTDTESRIIPAPGGKDFLQAYSPGKYPPMLAITRQRQSTSSMLWAWTRSSRRSRPATAGLCHPPRGRIPSHLSPRDRMRRKLQTRRGRQRYALRMQTVEPVFGQIKQGRGFRQFLLRGLGKVNGEWSLICTGHNLLTLFRFGVNLHRKARVDGPPQRIRNFAEVVEHGAIRKAIWGRPGQPAQLVVAIHCR